MQRIISAFLFFLSFSNVILARPADWFCEAEEGATVSWIDDNTVDMRAPGGLTLWNKQLMKGDVVIEYEARIVSDGRVSDLNCFWMASDPSAKDVFVNARRRGGVFAQTYTMQLYYVGFGGNYNKTTRFRRYTGDARGVDSAQYRPAILREYLDEQHLIKGDHWYKIRLEAVEGHVVYTIDGETLVDYVDAHPLQEGYFGFRTTLAHAQLRGFKVECRDTRSDAVALSTVGDVAVRRPQPVTFGVPFSQGELSSDALLSLRCDTGALQSDSQPLQSSAQPLQSDAQSLPCDQWTLASWPDGSVKWKAVSAVIPAGEVGRPFAATVSIAPKGRSGKASKRDKDMPLDMPVPHPSADDALIFDSISRGGKAVVGRVWAEMNGKALRVLNVGRESHGNVRDVWRVDGDNFSARFYMYGGSAEIKVVFTSFIDSLTNATALSSLCVKAEVPLRGRDYERRVLFLTDSATTLPMDVQPLYARRPIRLDEDNEPADDVSRQMVSNIARWDGFRLSQLSPNAFSVRKRATAVSPWIGTIEGRRAPGVVAVGDRQGAVAFHMDDFWQSYPSTLQVDNARGEMAVVSLFMWSDEAEAQRFEHYDTVAHSLEAAYEDVQPGMSTADGIARTTTLYIYTPECGIDSLARGLSTFAQHIALTPSPQYLHRKRAFGIWSLDSGSEDDRQIDEIVRFYATEQERNAWYGYFNYGDVMHTMDPDRGEWRYDVGGYAWDNTELATPAMLWYAFLRSGDATAWRMATAMTRHNSEVDTYHRGQHAALGTRHNVLHWGCGAKEARISQAFFNRFMYYLTADERLGDVMHEVVNADTLLYTLDPMRLAQPRSDEYPCTAPARLRVGPDWMAYAGNWFTEWERTGDVRWRDKIVAGMESIAALPHGLFSGPKALGYDPATGIITWEGDTAVQNTNHLLCIMGGFEMMTEMCLSLTTPAWQRVWTQHAVDYRRKALEISKNKFRIGSLNAMAWGLTGSQWHMAEARKETYIKLPLRATNDAATYVLDAIFLQEVGR